MITQRTVRNSGSVLTPFLFKEGGNATEQAVKMVYHGSEIFVDVAFSTPTGYFMPLYPVHSWTWSKALYRLTCLWDSPKLAPVCKQTTRGLHHTTQVEILALGTALATPLAYWWHARGQGTPWATPVSVVHGDPTVENAVGDGYWLDPSTRPMPLEAELDMGKILQSYFGYGVGMTEQQKAETEEFLRAWRFNMDLVAYYLMTHLVRLYKVQPQARSWAVSLAMTLGIEMEKLQCKL